MSFILDFFFLYQAVDMYMMCCLGYLVDSNAAQPRATPINGCLKEGELITQPVYKEKKSTGAHRTNQFGIYFEVSHFFLLHRPYTGS